MTAKISLSLKQIQVDSIDSFMTLMSNLKIMELEEMYDKDGLKDPFYTPYNPKGIHVAFTFTRLKLKRKFI